MCFKSVMKEVKQMIKPESLADVRLDSRQWLTLEAFMGLQTLSWGLAALVQGALRHGLQHHGDNALAWVLSFTTVGAAQMSVALYVYYFGRTWINAFVWRSATARTFLSGASLFAWLIGIATLVEAGGDDSLVCLLLLPFLIGNFFVFSGNWKLRTVLNADIPTTRLVARLARHAGVVAPVHPGDARSMGR